MYLEQYITKLNIEAETAAAIARTMLLPAAARHLALLRDAQLPELIAECEQLTSDFVGAIKQLESANLAENQPDESDRAREVHVRHGRPGDGSGPGSRRPAREGCRGRHLAAAEVLGDPLHQVAV